MFNLSKWIWNTPETKNDEFTVAVAESVTAGALTNTICSEPGASKFFKGSVIVYSIQSKKDILGIDIKYAEKTNFANPFTTSEMARAVCKMFKSRIGMSTTGYSLPIKREFDADQDLCALDIKHPYAYICLYDSNTNHEVVNRIEFTYNKNESDVIQRASVQTKVALEGRKMYLAHKKSVMSMSNG